MKKIVLLVAFIAGIFNMSAQSELDGYKYIIVKKQYGFQKSPDKYQLNSLTKFLLAKSDLNVLFDTDEFPDDLAVNSCLGLKIELLDESGMFNTQVSADFRDCKNNIVYSTPVGKSKSKEYKKAYHEAIRASLEPFLSYKHHYKAIAAKSVLKEPKDVAKIVVNDNMPAVKEVEEKAQNTIKSITKKQSVVGAYGNGVMSFVIKENTTDFELIHPEIGKIADLYSTSNSNLFIVKWLGKPRTKLVEFVDYKLLKIDSKTGVKVYHKKK